MHISPMQTNGAGRDWALEITIPMERHNSWKKTGRTRAAIGGLGAGCGVKIILGKERVELILTDSERGRSCRRLTFIAMWT